MDSGDDAAAAAADELDGEEEEGKEEEEEEEEERPNWEITANEACANAARFQAQVREAVVDEGTASRLLVRLSECIRDASLRGEPSMSWPNSWDERPLFEWGAACTESAINTRAMCECVAAILRKRGGFEVLCSVCALGGKDTHPLAWFYVMWGRLPPPNPFY
jgi:hypothetical protein